MQTVNYVREYEVFQPRVPLDQIEPIDFGNRHKHKTHVKMMNFLYDNIHHNDSSWHSLSQIGRRIEHQKSTLDDVDVMLQYIEDLVPDGYFVILDFDDHIKISDKEIGPVAGVWTEDIQNDKGNQDDKDDVVSQVNNVAQEKTNSLQSQKRSWFHKIYDNAKWILVGAFMMIVALVITTSIAYWHAGMANHFKQQQKQEMQQNINNQGQTP